MCVRTWTWKAWLANMDSFNKYHQELLGAVQRIQTQLSSLSDAANAIAAAKQVVCIGVGKSGFVAQKMSASLASISIQSIFLHPAEALHGDIGNVEEASVAVIFSKSGNSSEINNLLPFLKKRDCSIIAICNRQDSELGNFSDIFLNISIPHEGEPLNILPLISIDISMILANMLVGKASELSGLTIDRFAKNHPGGQLGRNVSLTLQDLPDWAKRTPFVTLDTPIMDAIATDSEYRAGLVCVIDGKSSLIGVMSDGDIRRAIRDGKDVSMMSVSDLMSSNPVTLEHNMLVGEAIDVMEQTGRKVFSAPVLDDQHRCVGVVTLHDLV